MSLSVPLFLMAAGSSAAMCGSSETLTPSMVVLLLAVPAVVDEDPPPLLPQAARNTADTPIAMYVCNCHIRRFVTMTPRLAIWDDGKAEKTDARCSVGGQLFARQPDSRCMDDRVKTRAV